MPYTYERWTDGKNKAFHVIHTNGWDIMAERSFCIEAEEDVKLIVDALNAYKS
jgi:hypothetical protein